MRLAALAVLLLVACAEPRTEEGETGLFDSTVSAPDGDPVPIAGLYAMVSLDGKTLPHKGLSGGLMEFRSDGTWELSVSFTSLAAPLNSSGGFSLGEQDDECVEVISWPDDSPDREDTISVCGGVLTLKPPHGMWIAVFEKSE